MNERHQTDLELAEALRAHLPARGRASCRPRSRPRSR